MINSSGFVQLTSDLLRGDHGDGFALLEFSKASLEISERFAILINNSKKLQGFQFNGVFVGLVAVDSPFDEVVKSFTSEQSNVTLQAILMPDDRRGIRESIELSSGRTISALPRYRGVRHRRKSFEVELSLWQSEREVSLPHFY